MDRRLQLLLDQDRYERVSQASQETGRSVAALIREAIVFRFPATGADARSTAALQLLEMTADPGGHKGQSPAQIKGALADNLASKAGPK